MKTRTPNRKHSRRPRARNRQDRSSYDSLETRRLLAGDVRVIPSEGSLFVRGDNEANQIEITSADDAQGSIRITGIDGTTVNGQSEFLVTGEAAQVFQGFRVNMGRGDDVLKIDGVTSGGRTIIYGSAGDDAIGLDDVTVGTATIQTFTGDDIVSLDNVIATGVLRILTLDGNDSVGISGLEGSENALIVTGSGNDRVAMKSSRIDRSFSTLTFDGDDYIGLDDVSVGLNFRVYAGDGADKVSVRDSVFPVSGIAAGQAGQDEVNTLGTTATSGTLTLNAFEGTLDGGISETTRVFNQFIRNGIRMGTITELAVLTPQLSTLTGALQATGLDSALNDEAATFTVFAPLNSAFDALPDGFVAGLTTEQLADVLKFHVSADLISEETLVTLSSVSTLLGPDFSVEITDGTVFLNGDATIAVTDIQAKNGVIHLLEHVLVPPSA